MEQGGCEIVLTGSGAIFLKMRPGAACLGITRDASYTCVLFPAIKVNKGLPYLAIRMSLSSIMLSKNKPVTQ